MRKELLFPLQLLLLLVLPMAIHGQGVQGQPQTVADQSCNGIDLEQAGYSVRSFKIEDPFDFLPWIGARERRAATRIEPLISGKPFQYASVRDAAIRIIEEENFLPDTSETRIKLRLLIVRVKNCSNKSVDVIYGVYSTQLQGALGAAPESRVEERKEPEKAAGLVNVDAPEAKPIRFAPAMGYDATDKLSGGGRFDYVKKNGSGVFNAARIEGQASSQMHMVAASATGSRDDVGWLAHLEWNMKYANSFLPTESAKLKGGNLSAQFAGTSRSLGRSGIVLRFGGLLEGGNRQSDLNNARLTSDTVSNSPYGAAKIFVGLAARSSRNSISGSYGLQLAASERAVQVDWVKHIADIKHELWLTLGDHRLLDLESQLTMGKIRTSGKIPLTERFFGGNHEQTFVTSDEWQIRANPVIRAIPGSRFFRTASGDGGDSFVSYNLTAAYTLWRKPLVPSELTKDENFRSLLKAQLINAEEFEKLYFLTKDEHFSALAAFIQKPEDSPKLQGALAELRTAVTAAQTAHPDQHQAKFQACLSAIRKANSRATSGSDKKGEELYGFVVALLAADEDLLTQVNGTCVKDLNGAGGLNGDPDIAAKGGVVEQLRQDMEREFAQIDDEAASRKAQADIIFVRHTINTLLNDVNLYSLSPVFVFDVARLGERTSSVKSVRYGPGVGLRLELVSAVHVTAGYAWNVKSGPGEGKGAMFFSMGLRDLFR